MSSIKLGELLTKARVVSEASVRQALSEQSKWGGKLGEILLRMGALNEETLVRALSKQMNVPSINLEQYDRVSPDVTEKVPAQVARDLVCVPVELRDNGRTLVVAMADLGNLDHIDTLRRISGCRIIANLAGRTGIARAFGRFYDAETTFGGPVKEKTVKFIDAQGRTVRRSVDEIAREHAEQQGTTGNAATPKAQLEALDKAQQELVTQLKSLVEELIERGVISREEYLKKVRAP